MFKLLFLFYFLTTLGGSALANRNPSSLWLVGKTSIGFYSSRGEFKTLEDLRPESSSLDPVSCDLWVQSKGRLLLIDRNLEIKTSIESNEHIVGNSLMGNSFFTCLNENWTQRNTQGQILNQFHAPIVSPTGLIGNNQEGYWTLDFQEKNKSLKLVHLSSKGQVHWEKTISEKKELWGTPKLHGSKDSSQLWISFSVTSPEHVYSPRVEIWSTSGDKIKTLQFSEKGLLLDSCLIENNTLLVSRDIPSYPYTAPLFTFLEKLDSNLSSQAIYKGPLNDLVPTIHCVDETHLWLVHKSLFDSEASWLGLLVSDSQEEKLLTLKEPAWKMHSCSLE